MALPDIDIYNWLLVDILKVQPTGDPVNDSIYLVLLPMVVLYMYVDKVVGSSRFATKKIEMIIMFIMAFFIIREGYYPMFAAFSMPLLIIVMLWHTLGFVFGKKNKGAASGGGGGGSHTRQEVGTGGGNNEDLNFVNKTLNLQKGLDRALKNTEQRISDLGEDKSEKAIGILVELEGDIVACNASRKKIQASLSSGRPVLGDPFSGVNSEEERIKSDARSAIALGNLENEDVKRKAPTIAKKLGIW